MCEKCEKLIMCDNTHKASTMILDGFKHTDPRTGQEWEQEPLFIGINHDEDTGEAYASIYGAGVCKKGHNEYTYGSTVFGIQYCPFCGEKIC